MDWGWVVVVLIIVGLTVYANPHIFQEIKDNVGNTLEKINSKPSNIVKLIPSEMEEYGFLREFHRSCASLEAMGESEGVSNIKQKVCREACGKRNMDYYSNDCEKDLLICYCISGANDQIPISSQSIINPTTTLTIKEYQKQQEDPFNQCVEKCLQETEIDTLFLRQKCEEECRS